MFSDHGGQSARSFHTNALAKSLASVLAKAAPGIGIATGRSDVTDVKGHPLSQRMQRPAILMTVLFMSFAAV